MAAYRRVRCTGLSSLRRVAKQHTYLIRNLFGKRDIGNTDSNLKAVIPGHDCLMVRLRKI
ncbi:MAG: hypothetical protein J5I94_19845 [Phaeodactylibacter sp.]|nr:hypothetical protein [Phaeodactylibacter sp.]